MSDIALAHLRSGGTVYMVDITARVPNIHQASAIARVDCSPVVMTTLRMGSVPKGDVLVMARVADITAAKQVSDLPPLVHTIGVYGCETGLELEDDHVAIHSTVRTADRTGVEMEVLTFMAMCAPALIDMVKGVDHSARINEAKITSKSGGRPGGRARPED